MSAFNYSSDWGCGNYSESCVGGCPEGPCREGAIGKMLPHWEILTKKGTYLNKHIEQPP